MKEERSGTWRSCIDADDLAFFLFHSMAAHEVAVQIQRLGRDASTDVHRQGATGMEAAAGWRVDRAGDVAFENDAILLLLGIHRRDR